MYTTIWSAMNEIYKIPIIEHIAKKTPENYNSYRSFPAVKCGCRNLGMSSVGIFPRNLIAH